MLQTSLSVHKVVFCSVDDFMASNTKALHCSTHPFNGLAAMLRGFLSNFGQRAETLLRLCTVISPAGLAYAGRGFSCMHQSAIVPSRTGSVIQGSQGARALAGTRS